MLVAKFTLHHHRIAIGSSVARHKLGTALANTQRVTHVVSSSCLSSASNSNEKNSEIQGVVDRIVFSSPQSGYTVGRLRLAGDLNGVLKSKSSVVFTGVLPPLGNGMNIWLRGTWVKHKKFGLQFESIEHRVESPFQDHKSHTTENFSVDKLESYLSSGLIKGIGKKTAKRIVEKFGRDTICVLNDENNGVKTLAQVSGLGPKKATTIIRNWKRSKSVQELAVFLQNVGLPVGAAQTLHHRYKGKAKETIERNPYSLIGKIRLGFPRADAVALQLGIKADSDIRLKAIMLHAISAGMSMSKHCYLPGPILLEQSYKLGQLLKQSVPASRLKTLLKEMVMKEDSVKMRDMDKFYLPEMYWSELGIATKIADMMNNANRQSGKIGDSERSRLSDDQRKAVNKILSSPVSILTGGPGTGKTYCLHALFDHWEKQNKRVLLASPTARAAKRLQTSTKAEASTIHRLLEFNRLDFGDDDSEEPLISFYEKTGQGFLRNSGNPLEMDCLIVDEASMLDVDLTNALLDAVPENSTVVFVGDRDQLPSVGAGQVFRDLMESGTIPIARLDTVFRQGRNSEIVRDAHRINTGQLPMAFSAPVYNIQEYLSRENEGFSYEHDKVIWVPADSPDAVMKLLQNDILGIVESFGLNPYQDMQVLSPLNKGPAGTQQLNQILQNVLNPLGSAALDTRPGQLKKIKTRDSDWRIGDKVMQCVNDYEKGVFNGDVGRIVDIRRHFKQHDGPGIQVNFEENDSFHHDSKQKLVIYSQAEMNSKLKLGYACTVHKSQGSEYPAIVLPLFTHQYWMLRRNLLYTAITRASKVVVLIGNEQAFKVAVQNNKSDHRYTALSRMLQETMLDSVSYQNIEKSQSCIINEIN